MGTHQHLGRFSCIEDEHMGGDSFSSAPSVALDQLAWEVALALVLCWSEGGDLFEDDHASTAATEHQDMD